VKSRAGLTAVELEVPFFDVDGLQVVWHGHYYKYFEIARGALMRAHRLDVSDMLQIGHRFLIAESHCRHRYPLRFGEHFRVEAWVTEVENRIGVSFEVTSLDASRRVARASTLMVTTDDKGELCLRTPEVIRLRLPAVEGTEVAGLR
jgi:acyl-CoA thioester hydrolase